MLTKCCTLMLVTSLICALHTEHVVSFCTSILLAWCSVCSLHFVSPRDQTGNSTTHNGLRCPFFWFCFGFLKITSTSSWMMHFCGLSVWLQKFFEVNQLIKVYFRRLIDKKNFNQYQSQFFVRLPFTLVESLQACNTQRHVEPAAGLLNGDQRRHEQLRRGG